MKRTTYYKLAPHRRVLVAIMNNYRDFDIAHDEHWYHIPVKSAPRGIDFKYLAFYHTKTFKEYKWSIRFVTTVEKREILPRIELYPDQPDHPRARAMYYKLHIGTLQRLARPIISHRGRRLVFIPTTLSKFENALELNDLFHCSPLEDLLWTQLKRYQLYAERQYFLSVNRVRYCLDFALFCKHGNIDVECDGDKWHLQKNTVVRDNERNNELTSDGWSVLRFNTKQLHHNLSQCVRTITRTIEARGGLIAENGKV